MSDVAVVAYSRMLIPAPEISGACTFVSSRKDSLTFTWNSATSATSYRLVGDGVSETSTVNTITAENLQPGTRHTFTVWAVGQSSELTSNNITCVDSTGKVWSAARSSFCRTIFWKCSVLGFCNEAYLRVVHHSRPVTTQNLIPLQPPCTATISDKLTQKYLNVVTVLCQHSEFQTVAYRCEGGDKLTIRVNMFSVDPNVSSSVTITDISQTRVTLSWSVGQTKIVNTTSVHYRTTDSEEWNSVSVTDTSHTVTSLQPGTKYQFYVKITSYGKSSSSQITTATTGKVVASFVM